MKDLLWPASRLGEALQALVAQALLPAAPGPSRTRAPRTAAAAPFERSDEAAASGALVPAPGEAAANPEALNEWLATAARTLGVEAQPAETPYADFDGHIRKLGPALLEVPFPDGPRFLAILPGQSLRVLGPDLQPQRASVSDIHSLVCTPVEAPVLAEVEQILERAGIAKEKKAAARDAILRERLSSRRIRGIWILRLLPSADFWSQLRQARVPQRLYVLAGAHAIQYGLWVLAWWVVGSNVLNRRADQSWLLLWALLLLTLVPLRVLITWLQGLVAIGAGARLKQRLFYGALRLEADSMRHQGAGQLLGRVLESEAVEGLALSGGFLALVALIELGVSIFVLCLGAGGLLQAGLLIAWLAVAAAIARRYYQRNRSWTDVRLALTHDLVESMVGHRTRLAQLPPDRWHTGEDEALESYLKSSQVMDHSTAALLALVPRGWLVLGLLGLAPAFVLGAASSGRIAIAVGGMLLAYRALRRCASGAWQLAGAAVAWQRVAVLYRAATRPEWIGSLEAAARARGEATLDARDLMFRYSQKSPPVLRGCTLRISPGDRLVLEGPSGGGKSTLVSLLIGLREPDSGQLRVAGLDRHTLGAEAWRKHIAAAPQFHENHVLAETFAFNLIMGRRKLPSPRDLPDAQAICRELGLAPLLERMPAGLLQMVGETGWQLSHGERSRLYVARALLQDTDLVVLDESFAALDPLNLQHALECVLRRARSLLVISHR
ncbi:MAG TPA: ABC transporter ATP-binding protein [Bryobacteraceae bacterium]|nr:ABC transporter ATP-binding protein [Bryobacteraceae bacterium]